MGIYREFFRDAVVFDIANSSRKMDKSLNSIEDSVKETNHRLEQLSIDINKHLININTELVLQSKILSNIFNILQNKRKTEAEELKKFGIFALKNHWFNEAEEDFLESLKFNKYDYQVYFLLSKVYANRGDNDKQIEYLNKSLKYSIEDVDFQPFIFMDMVLICINNSDFETADMLLKKSILTKKCTASCLTTAIVDIKRDNVSENTFKSIEDSIDLYESESPARIIEAVIAISTMLNQENKVKIQRVINKSKYKVLKQYSAISVMKINNLIDILSQISNDSNFITAIVPKPMIQQYCDNFKGISKIISQLKSLTKLLTNISIESYDYLVKFSDFFNYFISELISSYRLVLDYKKEGNFLEHPFNQKFNPEYPITGLKDNENILVQVELMSESLLTLTNQNIIITKKNRGSNILSIEEVGNIDFEIINKEEVLVPYKDRPMGSDDDYYFDAITFLLKKRDTEQILIIDKSLYYSKDYGNRKKFANILTLLWSLSLYNYLIITSMKKINTTLDIINRINDSYSEILMKYQIKSNNVSDDEIEFIDDEDVEFVD